MSKLGRLPRFGGSRIPEVDFVYALEDDLAKFGFVSDGHDWCLVPGYPGFSTDGTLEIADGKELKWMVSLEQGKCIVMHDIYDEELYTDDLPDDDDEGPDPDDATIELATFEFPLPHNPFNLFKPILRRLKKGHKMALNYVADRTNFHSDGTPVTPVERELIRSGKERRR